MCNESPNPTTPNVPIPLDIGHGATDLVIPEKLARYLLRLDEEMAQARAKTPLK